MITQIDDFTSKHPIECGVKKFCKENRCYKIESINLNNEMKDGIEQIVKAKGIFGASDWFKFGYCHKINSFIAISIEPEILKDFKWEKDNLAWKVLL